MSRSVTASVSSNQVPTNAVPSTAMAAQAKAVKEELLEFSDTAYAIAKIVLGEIRYISKASLTQKSPAIVALPLTALANASDLLSKVNVPFVQFFPLITAAKCWSNGFSYDQPNWTKLNDKNAKLDEKIKKLETLVQSDADPKLVKLMEETKKVKGLYDSLMRQNKFYYFADGLTWFVGGVGSAAAAVAVVLEVPLVDKTNEPKVFVYTKLLFQVMAIATVTKEAIYHLIHNRLITNANRLQDAAKELRASCKV